MNISPDYLIERKRNKWQTAKWKMVSLFLALVVTFFVGNKIVDKKNTSFLSKKSNEGYIATILLEEVIYDDLARVKKLEKLAKDEDVKAIIVHINSPGGSVVGSEMIYNAFRKISKNKPIVAVMDSLAASGGYLIALGADYIIAHNGTITGSIGVIMEMPEFTKLAEKIGIKFNNFKSSPLKANPSLTEELVPGAKEAMMDNVFDVYDYFVGLVAERRGLDLDFVKKISDGRIYSARLAMHYKLIDEIGNEDSAIKWLEEEKDITKGLEVFEVKLNPRDKIIDIILDDLSGSIKGLFSSNFLSLRTIF